MSSFLSLNLQDFGLNDDITETVKTTTPYCFCCLDKNVSFIRLINCKHASYLDNFLKPEIDYSNQFVCSICHLMLKKIDLFRRQVDESFRILSSQVNLLSTTHTRLCILKQTITNHLEVEDEEALKKDLPDISEPIVTIHEGPESEDLFTDLNKKVKNPKVIGTAKVLGNDSLSPTPKARKQTKEPLYKKFEGKIRMVQLTEQEMLEERISDAQSEAYLKFPYRCEMCVVGFDHEANYNDHMENRHKPYKGGITCTICKSVLAAGSSYRKHTKNHYTRYDCEECGKRYITLYSVMQHYNTRHGNIGVTHKCQHCDFTTDLISAYTYHRNKHRSNLKCSECGKQCSSNANLKTHLFAVHKKSNRTYDCTKCDKCYTTKSGLEHHSNTIHNQGNIPTDAYCTECNVQFNSTRCYKAHLRLSSKHNTDVAKKFKCAECGAKFATSTTMKRHVEWVHLKIFKHPCSKCLEVFRTRTLLKRHDEVVHQKLSPPRNKICQYCGKGFTTAQILRSHIRTHTGERPLRCPLCSATFAHNAALYTHKKLVHKVGAT